MSSSTLNQQVLRGLSCRLFAIPTLLVVLLMSATFTSAQETTGTILGTVTDSSGAVIPNATVTFTNTDRGAVIRTLQTDKNGTYNAPQLPIGHYSMSVEVKGFKTTTESGIILNVNDKLTKNETLTVGNVSETVSVAASCVADRYSDGCRYGSDHRHTGEGTCTFESQLRATGWADARRNVRYR